MPASPAPGTLFTTFEESAIEPPPRRPAGAPRRHPTTGRAAVTSTALSALAVTTLAGCSSAIDVAPPPQADAPGCAAVAAAWPAHVVGMQRSETSSDSTSVAAWGSGDQAIIGRCGVDSPPPTTQDCIAVDGVDWVARPLDDGTAFITYGRTPAVEVLVPKAHAPEPLVLGEFTGVGRAVAQGPHRCS